MKWSAHAETVIYILRLGSHIISQNIAGADVYLNIS